MGNFRVNQLVPLLAVSLTRGLMLLSIRVRVSRALTARSMLRYLDGVLNAGSRSAKLIAIGLGANFQLARLRICIYRLGSQVLVCFDRGLKRCFFRLLRVDDLGRVLSERASAASSREELLLRGQAYRYLTPCFFQGLFNGFRLHMIAVFRIFRHSARISTAAKCANDGEFYIEGGKVSGLISVFHVVPGVFMDSALYASYISASLEAIFGEDRFHEGDVP